MSSTWDSEHGCIVPGVIGHARHSGEPLCPAEIRALEDGAEIVVTWSGGNGPHPYRVLVDSSGARCVENLYGDHLLPYDGTHSRDQLQTAALNRVTLGWDPASRQVAASRPAPPAHIREHWAWLRGLTSRLRAAYHRDQKPRRHGHRP